MTNPQNAPKGFSECQFMYVRRVIDQLENEAANCKSAAEANEVGSQHRKDWEGAYLSCMMAAQAIKERFAL